VTKLTVVLPDDVASTLASEAARRGTSAEDLAAKFIGHHVHIAAPTGQGALGIIGMVNSGRSDLSERVEEILGIHPPE
jgi:hypothetical protein